MCICQSTPEVRRRGCEYIHDIDGSIYRRSYWSKWGSDKIDLLDRRIEALNNKLMRLVSESVSNGGNIEDYEDEFKAIANETKPQKSRICTIRENTSIDGSVEGRLLQIKKEV